MANKRYYKVGEFAEINADVVDLFQDIGKILNSEPMSMPIVKRGPRASKEEMAKIKEDVWSLLEGETSWTVNDLANQTGANETRIKRVLGLLKNEGKVEVGTVKGYWIAV